MNVLTLSIKQKYFDEILAGKKKQEFREIRLTNAKKYFRYFLNGKEYDEETLPLEDEEPGDIDLVPVKYDAIKFLTGAYIGKRPWAMVEVKGRTLKSFVMKLVMTLFMNMTAKNIRLLKSYMT